MVNLLEKFNLQQMELRKNPDIEDFVPGDTITVEVNIFENGAFSRVQSFQGVCIARVNRGIHSSFRLRRSSLNDGMEIVYPLYSSIVRSVKIVRRAKVRRAKLYYLRGLKGKAARLKTRIFHKKSTA